MGRREKKNLLSPPTGQTANTNGKQFWQQHTQPTRLTDKDLDVVVGSLVLFVTNYKAEVRAGEKVKCRGEEERGRGRKRKSIPG